MPTPSVAWLVLAWVAFDLLVVLVNGMSVTTDMNRRGADFEGWEPYAWELTSWLGFAMVVTPAILADTRLAGRGWALRLPAFGLGSLLFSGLHVAIMVSARIALYRLHARHYDFGPLRLGLAYEYRKDLLSFIGVLASGWLWRRWVVTAAPAAAEAGSRGARMELSFLAKGRTGEVLIRASEIDWVEAQGNYVALHVDRKSYLLRQSMKELDAKLRDTSFIRTHRSALVNARRVRGISRSEMGGLRVELANQQYAPLSDRRRASVIKGLAAG